MFEDNFETNQRRRDVLVNWLDHLLPMENFKLVPPDGGWGWVIVGANAFLALTIPSITIAFGVVYVALLEQTNINNMEASFIVALTIGLASLLGPASTSMSLFYSHRILILIGVSLVSIGLALCSISLNLFWLYICYGVLGGVGYSLVLPNSFLISQEYFAKRRVIANVIYTIGLSSTLIVMPLFIQVLIVKFSLKGAFLIWSSVMFNGVVAAMLYHPVKWHLKKEKTSTNMKTIKEVDETSSLAGNYTEDVDQSSDEVNDNLDTNNSNGVSNVKMEISYRRNSDGDPNLRDMNFTRHANITTEILPKTFDSQENEENDIFYDFKTKRRPLSLISDISMDSFKTTRTNYKSIEGIYSSLDFNEIYKSAFSLYTNEEIPWNMNSQIRPISKEETNELNTNQEPKNKNSMYIIFGMKFPRVTDIISIKLLNKPIFLICIMSSVCLRQLYHSFTIYLPVVASLGGFQDKLPFLFLIFAITEILSKVIIAQVSDKGWMAMRYYYILGSIMNLISIIVLLVDNSLIHLAISSGIFGCGMGICISIGPILLVEHLEMKQLPYSYGITLFITGLFTLPMYPLQGLAIDASNSTEYLFIIFAVLAVIPAIMWSLGSIFLLRTKQCESGNIK